MSIVLRPGRLPDDVEALAQLYIASVCELAPSLYTPEQVDAWAAWPKDRTAFEAFLRPGLLIVAECDGELAGLGYLHPADHLSLLYTHPHFARQGIATRLCHELEAASRRAGCTRICTEASQLSRPLFERQGFTIQEIEVVDHYGARFSRYKMAKELT